MRAPWHWRWGQIALFLLRCAAWAGALYWSPVFAIPLAVWLVLLLKQDQEPLPKEDPQPLPRQEPEVVPYKETAGHKVEKRYNDAQVTITPECVEVAHPDGLRNAAH